MAELQHQYKDWADRKAGRGDDQDGGEPGAEGADGQQPEGEPPPPAHECLANAAQEITEAIEMLEKAKGQVEEPDDIQTAIDALTEQQQALTEQAKELEEEAGDAEDDDTTPEPEPV